MKPNLAYTLVFFLTLCSPLCVQAQENEIIREVTEDKYFFTLERIQKTADYSDSDLFLKLFYKSNKMIISQIKLNDDLYQGNILRGPVSIIIRKIGNNAYYIFLESIPGGDGDRREKRLKIILFADERFKLLVDINIDDTTYKYKGETITISGASLIGLCAVCDGPDDGPPETIFRIPLAISLQSGKISITCPLDLKKKNKLMREFSERVKQEYSRVSKEFLLQQTFVFIYYISVDSTIMRPKDSFILP